MGREKDEKTYGFNRADAEALAKSIGSDSSEFPEPRARPGLQVGVFYTPSGGIPARSGTTMGSASCTRVSFDGATITATDGPADDVRNLGTEAVAGSSYIQCLFVDGTWLANWEQCE